MTSSRGESHTPADATPQSPQRFFSDDELFGIYSIVSGFADRIDPRSPLAIMRNEAVAELERREHLGISTTGPAADTQTTP